MRPSLYFIACGLVFPSIAQVAHAQAQNSTSLPAPALSVSDRQLISRLVGEWKEYFRSISTLDLEWQMSGSWMSNPDERHTYRYHFSQEPNRYRLDTKFYSSQVNPQSTQNRTVLKAGNYFKAFDVTRTGFARLDVHPYALGDHRLGTVIPIIDVFMWARPRGSKHDLTLESFASEAFWNNFDSRVQKVEIGQWQGHQGWWLSVAKENVANTPNLVRVFIDAATSFPFYAIGRVESSETGSKTTYVNKITKTWPRSIGGKTWLFPRSYSSYSWQHNVKTGKRSQQLEEFWMPTSPKVNTPIAPQRWELPIPANTSVSYTPSYKKKVDFNDVFPFDYNPQGGSLWQQEKDARDRYENGRKRLRALPAIYDEKADGEEQVAAALKVASAQNKAVLLQFGAWWCPPCHTMHDLFTKDPVLAPLINANYVLVPIDVNNGHNGALFERLRSQGQGGIPMLVVLDASGKRIAAPADETFETKESDQKAYVKALADFLNRWKPQQP